MSKRQEALIRRDADDWSRSRRALAERALSAREVSFSQTAAWFTDVQ